MKYIAVLLLFVCGCAAPLTEEEQFEKEYKEADRKNLYIMWERRCKEQNGIIYSYNPTKPCYGRDLCIPHRRDWSYDSKKERPALGNTVMCLSQRQVRDIFN